MACFDAAPVGPSIFFLLLLILVYCSETRGEETTHLHFYLHEITSGPNATVVTATNLRNDSSLGFGFIGVIDDMLKEGPDPSSKLIGRYQGLASVASMDKDNAFLTMVNLVFTDGPYNGSTLAVIGRLVLGTVFERPIVGGTGEFRMARGYIIGKQVPSQLPLLISEFDAYISH